MSTIVSGHYWTKLYPPKERVNRTDTILGKECRLLIATELAQRTRQLVYTGLPETTPRWAEMAFLDTVAVALAGCREPCVQILRGLSGIGNSSGPCLTFDDRLRCDVLDATLINTTASHALDFDDFASGIRLISRVLNTGRVFSRCFREQKSSTGQIFLITGQIRWKSLIRASG